MHTFQRFTFFIALALLFACNSADKKVGNTQIKKDTLKTEAVAQSEKSDFPENNLGVVYLDSLSDTHYTLTIRFPNAEIPETAPKRGDNYYSDNIPLNLPPQTIVIFDEAGELTTLKNLKNCVSKLWCENDGGLKYEPTYIFTVLKSEFSRTLKLKNKDILGKISAFAVVNFNASHFNTFHPESDKESKDVIMRGRLSTNYAGYDYKIPEVYKYYDRNVQICFLEDESEPGHYCILLESFNDRDKIEIGCCGP